MTSLIEPEDQTGKTRKVLIRSNIKTRRKHIGTEIEFVNDDPQYANFFLSPTETLQYLEEQQVDVTDVPTSAPLDGLCQGFLRF